MENDYYKSITAETNIVDHLSKRKQKFNISKARKRLKIVGWILGLSNVAALHINGKTMIMIQIFTLLVVYAIYIHYYPYIYTDAKTEKSQKNTLQIPFVGACIAMLSCLSIIDIFTYDFGHTMKITCVLTILLAIPYIIKSIRITVPQSTERKLSVIFTVFLISFSIAFPVNYLLTFDKSEHKTIIITDKHMATGAKHRTEYYLGGNYNGKKRNFNVAKSEYNSTSIGDIRRVCIRKSALGLKYYTIHK